MPISAGPPVSIAPPLKMNTSLPPQCETNQKSPTSSLIAHVDHDHNNHTHFHPHHSHEKEWDKEFTTTFSLPQHSGTLIRAKYDKLVQNSSDYLLIVDRYTRSIVDDLWSSHTKEYTLSPAGVATIKGIIFSLAQDVDISSLSSHISPSSSPSSLSTPSSPFAPKKTPPPPPLQMSSPLCIGSAYRVLDSPRYRYGKVNPSQEAAFKAWANHFRNLQIVFELFNTLEVMPIPTFAVQLEYRGRRMSAHPTPEVGELIYGSTSLDEDAVVHNDDAALGAIIDQVAQQLHLAPHSCGKNNVTLALPVDAQVYRTKSGHLRLRNIARLMPEEYFDEKNRGNHFLSQTNVRLLRPEFLQRLKKAGMPALSPDALLERGSDHAQHKANLIAASRYLHETVIPQFQTELIDSWRRGNAVIDYTKHSVEVAFHTRGINMRHLGEVFMGVRDVSITDITHPQSLLFAEMASRAFKHHMRAILRDESGHQHSITACAERVVPVLNALIGLDNACWTAITDGMAMRFGFLAAHLADFTQWRGNMANIRKIVQPALARTGVVLAENTWEELVKEPGFAFHFIHIAKIAPAVKQLSYTHSAMGSRFFREAKASKSPSVQRKLFTTMEGIFKELRRKTPSAFYHAGSAIASASLADLDEDFLIADHILINHLFDLSNQDSCLLSFSWTFATLFHMWETRLAKHPILACGCGAADLNELEKVFELWLKVADRIAQHGQQSASSMVISISAARVRAYESLLVLLQTGNAEQAIAEGKASEPTTAPAAIAHSEAARQAVQDFLPVVGTSGRVEILIKALTTAFDSNITQLILMVVGASLGLEAGVKKWIIAKVLTLEDLRGFETLVKSELDVRDENGNGVLHLATTPSVVKHLITQGADLGNICRGGRTPLIAAVFQKNCAKVETILDAMPGQVSLLNTREAAGHSALSVAICLNCTEMIKRLLHERADPNLHGPEGFSMLQFAAVKNPASTVQELIAAGAQVNYQGPFGFTALMFAAKYGRIDVCKLLLNAGADITLTDDAGRTMLMHTTAVGHVETLRFLLEHVQTAASKKAWYFINVKDHRGRGTLLHALRKKNHGCVPLLLEHGALVNEPDCYGSTAIEYCDVCDDEAMRATRKLITQVQQSEDTSVVGPQSWFKKVNSFSKPGRRLKFDILSPSSSTGSTGSSTSSNGAVTVTTSPPSVLPKYGELIRTVSLGKSESSSDNWQYSNYGVASGEGSSNYDFDSADRKDDECEPPAMKSNYDDPDDSLYRPYSFNDSDLTFEQSTPEVRKNTKTANQWKDAFVSVFAMPTSPSKHRQLETLLTELQSVAHEFSSADQQSVDFLICTARHLLRESREHQHFQDEKFYAKDWNEQFCRAVLEPDVVLKYQKLTQLSMDFITLITNYGRTIISELFLEEGRTVGIKDLGGAAGGRKYVVRGILFKLAKDVNHGGQWLYGGHAENYENANKGAAHDLRGASACFKFYEKGVFVPMQALLDFHGYRLVCMPMLPLATDTLIWGSADGGKTIHKDDHNFNDLMKEVAAEIHLAEHLVVASGNKALGVGPMEVSMATAGDVEGHKGKDGRFYLLDLARLLPPQDPFSCKHLELKSNAVFFRLFRPEFLSSFKALGHPALSPDALTNWGNWPQAPRSCAIHNENVRMATKLLVEVVIPEFADFLVHLPVAKLMTLSIPQEAHRRGINIHHLGLAYTLLTNPKHEFQCLQIQQQDASDRLLVELLGRVVKNVLRNTLRVSHRKNKTQPSEFESINTVVDFLNDFLRGPDGGGARRWGEIERGFFPRYGLLIPDIWARVSRIPGSRHTVINYVLGAVGIVLRHDTTLGFEKNRQTEERFEFSSMDIQQLSVRVKYMSIIDQSSAELLNMNVQKSLAETMSCNESSERLLLLAVNTFGRNLTSDPLNRSLITKAEILRLQYKAFMLRKEAKHLEADLLFLMAIEHAVEEGLHELAVGLGRLLLTALQAINRADNLHLLMFDHIHCATRELFSLVPEHLLHHTPKIAD